MEDSKYRQMEDSLVSIASEFFRFQGIFEKAISKLGIEDQSKYKSQYAWLSKKVTKALENSELSIVNLEGEFYDPGMAVTPLNLDEFQESDVLFVEQMIEPIVMRGGNVIKTGTVILGRVD